MTSESIAQQIKSELGWVYQDGQDFRDANRRISLIEKMLDSLVGQLENLRLTATRQLTPLDVAATHIDIIRRKGDEYTVFERDNVAAIVESHVKEARSALFDAISNPAKELP